MKASIIIPTYNGDDTLRGCLEAIFSQSAPWHYEVKIVDSGSTDETLEIATQYPVHIKQIPNSAFNHGGTRNQAAADARGEYIVFLVQDAQPLGEDWLVTLITAAEQNQAAGAFGSQEPRPDASLYTKWEMTRNLPKERKPVVKCLASPPDWKRLTPFERYNLAFFHNANSCVRRDILLKFPLRKIPYGEDMDWAKRVLLAGYSIVYEPRARVLHSHDRSIIYEFKRAYSDHSLVKELFELQMIRSPLGLVKALRWNFVNASRWVWKRPLPWYRKLPAVLSTTSLAGAQVMGTYLGSRYTSLANRYPYLVKLDKKIRRGV
ncbi:MAG: glycosyltransferase [Anaerolineales bacterium]|jgi:rhamnosyltransferase